jgi:hypothetical protein
VKIREQNLNKHCGYILIMVEGKRINLRLAERDDVSLLAEWFNDVRFAGDHQHFPVQTSKADKAEIERRHQEWIDFIIEKKDGTKIGWAC